MSKMAEPSNAERTQSEPTGSKASALTSDLFGLPAHSPPGRAEGQIRCFIENEQRRVVATVSLWTDSFDDAAAAVTDALGRAWEQLDRGGTIDNLAAWVTRVAMNQIRSGHRRSKVAQRKRHLIAVVDVHDDTTARTAAAVDLQRALTALTKRQRQVVALYYGLDQSVTAIADTLGVAPGTVKATLHQARNRLAELLDATSYPPTSAPTSPARSGAATTAPSLGASDD